jgi:hypothetical protein
LRSSKKTILLITVVSVVSILSTTGIAIYLSTFHNYTIPSLGTVKTIGVEAYWDRTLKNETFEIDWGPIWVGNSTYRILHIRSVSNYDVILNLNITNWIPKDISDYITVSWNYTGKQLVPGEIVPVKLTVSSPNTSSFISYLIDNSVTRFEFEIHIIASEPGSKIS